VDTVHQGDPDGQKGVYHLNTVDEVTLVGDPWGVVARSTYYTPRGCVSLISERYLVPVLEDLLTQYPFLIHGIPMARP